MALIGRDPAPQLQKLGRAVLVRRRRLAKRKLAQVLQHVVDGVKTGIALLPQAIAQPKEIRRKGRKPKEVIAAVHYHVDGKVVARVNLKLGPDLIPHGKARPLDSPVE